MSLTSIIAAPTMSAGMFYDNAVYRGPTGQMKADWQLANKRSKYIEDRVEAVAHRPSVKQSTWQSAVNASVSTSVLIASGVSAKSAHSSDWKKGISVKNEYSSEFSDMIRQPRPSVTSTHQLAVPVSAINFSGWQDRFRRPRPTLKSTWGLGVRMGIDRLSLAGVAQPLLKQTNSHWQVGKKPPAGMHTRPVVPPVGGCYTPPKGSSVDLLFNKKFVLSTNILFSCAHSTIPPATQIVPVRRTYIVINDVSLRRVEGNHILPDVSLTLNIDMDSWTWGFSATLPASVLSLIEPGVSGDPVILEAKVNGASYLLLAEGIQRDRVFGKSSIQVTGRGQSAMLADPYSPILTFANTADRTAQQLMNDALMVNGVSLGWAVDWRIGDWLVPAGVWTYQGSYMSAVTTIAAAAGAFIQPDPVNKTLRVRPRYPVKPWEWASATPDLELPSAAIVKESISWMDKPAYNAVYISGANDSGILGYVRRTGSAGDLLAPMVTDALTTDAIAARQRGISILADTGRSASYSLSLPILPETGIIDPGSLVRYVDSATIIGVVKSVSVSASQSTARQTIEVQTYV
ncbi:hypothetical protein [Undibacterium sp. Xuan67W]|uniref:hypothetical protein n=1 Tax=Undibacterium sp. Xuan67W TaxID=3413057 RepID=UPI003BF0C1D3